MEHTAIPWERETLEKLLFAELRERRNARRWRTLLWLLFIAAMLAPLLLDRFGGSLTGGGGGATPHTAMVRIHGVIMDGEDASAENILPALRDAMESKHSKALMLHFNSPGGSAVQAGMIVDELRRLKSLHKKPIHAVVEDTCASAAYYIASAADNIYVDKASVVGSIGVLIDSFGFTGAMDKMGIERRLITAGENKGFLDPFSPMTEEQLGYARQLTNNIHKQFISVVREGRGERLKETPDMYSGMVWTGEQSLALGLADAYGSMDSVARDIVKAEDIVDYTHKPDLAERLTRQLTGAISRTAVGALRTVQVR